MPSSSQTLALIEKLLAAQDPAIRRAFLAAMQDARDAVVLEDVVEALKRGDVEAAVRALELNRAFLAPLDQALSGAYYQGGRELTALLMAEARRNIRMVEVRFDPGAPRAAFWLRQHSSELIEDIRLEHREAVREALLGNVRGVLGAGMEAGQNPLTVALDITGRINKDTKRREGGIFGLNQARAQYVENARAQLSSGDPVQMQAYLERRLRDRRFDSVVRKAIREGRPLSKKDVHQIIARYSDRQLADRGKVIGRTEALTALSHSQAESMEQFLDAGDVRADAVEKTWRSRGDGRTRDSHVSMNGQTVPLRQPFVSPSGARMMFPRDRSLGAGAKEIIQCRCFIAHSINWAKVPRRAA
jgi:hypothetical protein